MGSAGPRLRNRTIDLGSILFFGWRAVLHVGSGRLGRLCLARVVDNDKRGWLSNIFKNEGPDWNSRSSGGPFSTSDLIGTWNTK